MSLAEKWEEYRIALVKKYPDVRWSTFQWARMREGFYAGAEAAMYGTYADNANAREFWAEIDHFRSLRAGIDKLSSPR